MQPLTCAGPRNSPPAAPGFTIIELVVVIIILAIAAAMIVPQITGTADMQAQAAARMVTADLEYAQNYAIVTQTDITVTFDTSGNAYKVSNGSDTLIHPITKKAYEIDFAAQGGFDGVSVAAAGFGGGSAVTFSALGAPDNEGTVDLAAGEHAYRVTVAPVTGRVSVAKLP